MPGSTAPSFRDVARAELVAGVLVSLALTVADVAGAASRPLAPSLVGLLVLAVAGWPLGAAFGAALVVPRGALVRALGREARAGYLVAGAIDGSALFVLAVYAQSPRALADANVRSLVLGLALAGGGALGWGWHRFVASRPRIAQGLAAVVAVGAAVTLGALRWNGDAWLRLALQACVVVAVARAARPWLLRVPRVAVVTLGASLALVGALGWLVALPQSRDGRRALYHRSSHVRSWAYVIDRVTWSEPLPSSRPSPDRQARAGSGSREPASRGATSTRAISRSFHGAARGHDVLLLSVDSLRWDALDEMSSVRAALGPHAAFLLATSPAPATRDSLPATLRGRAVRELRIEPAGGANGDVLWRDPSPTLAHVLTSVGYRAITIPTSNQSEPRLGIQSGFDTVWLNNADAPAGSPIRSPFEISYTPGHVASAAVTRLARNTPGPLLLWVHLMEPHYPYHWSATEQGPLGMQAFRRAARYEARLLSRLIRDLRAIRRRQAVIAIFGDHGEEFGEHGGNFHGSTVHAEQSRVVLLLAGAGIPAITPDAPVSTTAIPATVLDLLGVDAPRSMTVPSLLPPIAGERPWPEVAVTEMRAPYRSATGYTTSRFRLLRDAAHDVEQLFDLRADPHERRDLATERGLDLARMRRIADQWDRERD